jgi:hypothetical protein
MDKDGWADIHAHKSIEAHTSKGILDMPSYRQKESSSKARSVCFPCLPHIGAPQIRAKCVASKHRPFQGKKYSKQEKDPCKNDSIER